MIRPADAGPATMPPRTMPAASAAVLRRVMESPRIRHSSLRQQISCQCADWPRIRWLIRRAGAGCKDSERFAPDDPPSPVEAKKLPNIDGEKEPMAPRETFEVVRAYYR